MLRQIRYFQTIARCGSFTEAADECFISQSAISQQLQALERELSVQLIDRSKRKLVLTPAGEHFYKRSLLLSEDFEKLCRETVNIAQKNQAQLKIGNLRCYGGNELQLAVAAFSALNPDVSVSVINGNHEELYDLIRMSGVDLVLNDQRRAFSDEYVNFELITTDCYVEVAGHNPLAKQSVIEVSELKDNPCILVASKEQRKNESKYYKEIVGFHGDFLFADNLEEARLLILSSKGVLPVEGVGVSHQSDSTFCRIPLLRAGKSIRRKYCAFWKIDNNSCYVKEFARLLKRQFPVEQ